MPVKKLDLRDVTLCAIDTENVSLTARALHRSIDLCDFADSILFTSKSLAGRFRCVEIDRLNAVADYSEFLFKRLVSLIETPYVLVVQWDGYVVDPGAWRDAMREYDFIGARWPEVGDGMAVGNSGFCLCSRRFLAATAHRRFPLDPETAADWLICRAYRPSLERDFGIRFAPEDLADTFSHENVIPAGGTFGFHGLSNMWRYVPDEEMVGLIRRFAPYVFTTAQCALLLHAYYMLGRPGPLSTLYTRMKRHLGDVGTAGHLMNVLGKGVALEVLAGSEQATSPR
ncbi:MAG TPA: DUF5672 family protein [Bauldia sp.]|nr:DUF5672 family protein [Bauldia sp.]